MPNTKVPSLFTSNLSSSSIFIKKGDEPEVLISILEDSTLLKEAVLNLLVVLPRSDMRLSLGIIVPPTSIKSKELERAVMLLANISPLALISPEAVTWPLPLIINPLGSLRSAWPKIILDPPMWVLAPLAPKLPKVIVVLIPDPLSFE